MPDPKDPPDLHLFRDEVAGTLPLEQPHTAPFRRALPPRPLPQPAHLREMQAVTLSESEVETGDFLDFSRPGVQQRVRHELRRGGLEPEWDLDLHGLTADYAQQMLEDFLHESRRRGLRCVRIIHGKGYRSDQGQPVLKRKVNYWLRLYEDVLAFCSATRRDGGTGAVYVLLRNPRKGTGR